MYTIEAYRNLGTRVVTTVDASPWAIGGLLILDGEIFEFFYERVRSEDLDVLGVEYGTRKSQQAFEALALIVALKTWAHHWQNLRVCLTVRSDSVSGLTVMMKHKSSGEAPALIAREAALLISRSTYTPTIYEHIPGIANVIADTL